MQDNLLGEDIAAAMRQVAVTGEEVVLPVPTTVPDAMNTPYLPDWQSGIEMATYNSCLLAPSPPLPLTRINDILPAQKLLRLPGRTKPEILNSLAGSQLRRSWDGFSQDTLDKLNAIRSVTGEKKNVLYGLFSNRGITRFCR